MIGLPFLPDHTLVSPAQPTHPQLAVSGAIFRDGKVLLVRRARSPGKGFYSFPGGRVEFGELLHTALHREVDEETGLRNRDRRPRRLARSAAGNRRRRALSDHVVRGPLDGQEPVLNDEHDDFKWLEPDAIGDLQVTGGLQEVIEAARRLI